jgi:hypothetical protein
MFSGSPGGGCSGRQAEDSGDRTSEPLGTWTSVRCGGVLPRAEEGDSYLY